MHTDRVADISSKFPPPPHPPYLSTALAPPMSLSEEAALAARGLAGELPTAPLGGEMFAEMSGSVLVSGVSSNDCQPFSFKDFAEAHGLQRFASLLADAGLAEFIDNCETALTIFAPSDEAFARLSDNFPTDTQLLRELLCVHITIGSLSHKELLNTRSITTIGQQTHHVALLTSDSPSQLLQVGTAMLTQCDIMLPNNRGVLHSIDSVMCCLRLLQHCRFEQVWNKTVRPAPKLALQGEWQPHMDELHAILIHCDSWQPLFQGLRGAQVPLYTSAERQSKAFQDGVIHFHELLILEKPPEMSKKKRKKKDSDVDGTTAASAEGGGPTANYRMMFSLYRREGEASSDGSAPVGKHLTFCMAPEDILIRNSFHMLSEVEKEARRAEYKELTNGSTRTNSSGKTFKGPRAPEHLMPSLPLTMGEVLTGSAMAQASAELQAAQRPPLLVALSTHTGGYAGGTSVWIQGSQFCQSTQVFVAGVLAPRINVVSEGLVTITTPPVQPGMGTVEVRATNNGTEWSNMLHFMYTSEGGMTSETHSVENQLMQRQLSLLQQFVQACCGAGAEASVHALMAPTLGQQQRLFGAVLALILAGSGGTNIKGGALDLERQDAYGCTLMHYVCALRNSPALQLLLHANVDPMVFDSQGMSAADWARAYRFHEGETLISRAMGMTVVVPQPLAPQMGTSSSITALTQPIAVTSSDPHGNAGCLDAQWVTSSVVDAPVGPTQGMHIGDQQPGAAALMLGMSCGHGDAAGLTVAAPVGAEGATPLARTRSLEQFLQPAAHPQALSSTSDVHQRSLAGFLTAAAAHVDNTTK